MTGGRAREKSSGWGVGPRPYLVSLVVLAAAGVTGSEALVAFAACVFGLLALREEWRYSRARGGWSPLASYLVFVALVGAGNTAGMLAIGGPLEADFDRYASHDHLGLGLLTALLEATSVTLGFDWWRRRSERFGAFRSWPVAGSLSRKTLLFALPSAVILVVLLEWRGLIPSLGALSGAVRRLPVGAAFGLAYFGSSRNDTKLVRVGLLVAAIETVRAVMFEFLRSSMLLPSAALILGLTAGGGLLRRRMLPYVVPVAVFAALFVTYFQVFGTMRDRAGYGAERITEVQEALADNERPGWLGLAARLTTFNQLSAVHFLAERDGLRGGDTLAYWAYAFVPRFLWPEKPIVQLGGWFAWAIGKGYITPDGRYSNSINMTVGGELYLNFGWPGVALGALALGALLALFWGAGGLRREGHEMATLYSFNLFLLGFGLGADLQIVVTMTATYLVFVAAGRALTIAQEGRKTPRAAGPQGVQGAAARDRLKHEGKA